MWTGTKSFTSFGNFSFSEVSSKNNFVCFWTFCSLRQHFDPWKSFFNNRYYELIFQLIDYVIRLNSYNDIKCYEIYFIITQNVSVNGNRPWKDDSQLTRTALNTFFNCDDSFTLFSKQLCRCFVKNFLISLEKFVRNLPATNFRFQSFLELELKLTEIVNSFSSDSLMN